MYLALIFCVLAGTWAYLPDGKENFMPPDLLRELVNRMGKNIPFTDEAYFDFPEGHLLLGERSLDREVEEEPLFPMDYEGGLSDVNLHPSIRDQEFLEHSSLWGNQYVSGGAGEGKQHLKPEGSIKNIQEIKSDASLPAYCNPPNPCPVGYTSEQGCIEDFENTASYSRRYQANQECMCDSEHMFDCPNPGDPLLEEPVDNFNDMEFNRFLQQTIQNNPSLQHKNLVVAKKFHQNPKQNYLINPFLSGERLPIAAKKGNNVHY